MAHKTCIECGGKTVAVLGWGIEEPMIDYDKILAEKIIQSGGLIISEWKKQKGALWTFPQRNRIVAALSKEIYVVEAAERSGALITAEIGIKMGKKIWAVPGPVTSRVSVGTNRLIKDGKAEMWLPDNVSVSVSVSQKYNIDLYTTLQIEPLTVDELVIKTRKPAAELMADLTVMLLKGEVTEREGKYYILE
jgi:DNA processing protein